MRLRSWNAYESELTSGIDGSTNTITIISSVGLTAPVVLVIDPEDQGLREYVMVTTVAASTLTVDRGLAGSAVGGQPHVTGSKIRAVPVHQWLDEIFDDIDIVASDLVDHEGAVDPHVQYLLLSGGTMMGALVLSGDPTVALNPATKQYVDSAVESAPSSTVMTANTNPSGGIIGTTYSTMVPQSINIPASWNTYDVLVTGAGAFSSDGVTIQLISARVRFDGVSGTEEPAQISEPPASGTIAVNEIFVSQTATGFVQVELQLKSSLLSVGTNDHPQSIQAIAIRTS